MAERRMSRAEERAAELRAQREARVPLGGHMPKLGINKDRLPPGFVARWFKGAPDRLEMAKRAGWEDAPAGLAEKATDVGTRQSAVVGGLTDDNQPRRDYLMMIPEEIYKEDQRRKQELVDAVEATIVRSGTPNPNDPQARELAGHSYGPGAQIAHGGPTG